jgi:hypothetical protein
VHGTLQDVHSGCSGCLASRGDTMDYLADPCQGRVLLLEGHAIQDAEYIGLHNKADNTDSDIESPELKSRRIRLNDVLNPADFVWFICEHAASSDNTSRFQRIFTSFSIMPVFGDG